MGNVSWWVYALFPTIATFGLMLAVYKRRPAFGSYRIIPSVANNGAHEFAVEKYERWPCGWDWENTWKEVFWASSQKQAEYYILRARMKDASDKVHLSIPTREVPPYRFIDEEKENA